jgi:hypothetical protein
MFSWLDDAVSGVSKALSSPAKSTAPPQGAFFSPFCGGFCFVSGCALFHLRLLIPLCPDTVEPGENTSVLVHLLWFLNAGCCCLS